MIAYELFCQIREMHQKQKLNAAQIARHLGIHYKTALKWMGCDRFTRRANGSKPVLLDPYRGMIAHWLDSHDYTAQQVYQRLQEEGYTGSLTLVRNHVRLTRPVKRPVYLKLHFEPGECAQVDWGEFGSIPVDRGQRRLSFFVMVLAYCRMMYVEFTLSQSMEYFLACHEHAFQALGGVPSRIMVDNLKSAVLSRLVGSAPVLNQKYLDFARHYGFDITPCAVAKGNEYGVVKNMSRWVSIAPVLPLKLTFLSRHNFWLQGAKEGHQIGLVAPMFLSSRTAFHFTCGQCPSLCFQIDLGVDIRRRQRNVPKPTAYRVDVDSGLEQQRGSRVSYDMRVHVFASQ